MWSEIENKGKSKEKFGSVRAYRSGSPTEVPKYTEIAIPPKYRTEPKTSVDHYIEVMQYMLPVAFPFLGRKKDVEYRIEEVGGLLWANL